MVDRSFVRRLARSLRVVVVACVASVVVSLAGASSLGPSASAASISFGSKLDLTKVKKAIEESAAKAYAPAKVGKVTCPKSVKPKAGNVFTCTIPVADGVLNIAVTQKDGKGNVTFVAKEAVLDVAKIKRFVEAEVLSDINAVVTADCGKGVVKVLAPGGVIKCRATDKTGDFLDLIVTVKDIDGNVTLTSV
jgi:hypothetical protein